MDKLKEVYNKIQDGMTCALQYGIINSTDHTKYINRLHKKINKIKLINKKTNFKSNE